jgi:hypothetical protein
VSHFCREEAVVPVFSVVTVVPIPVSPPTSRVAR